LPFLSQPNPQDEALHKGTPHRNHPIYPIYVAVLVLWWIWHVTDWHNKPQTTTKKLWIHHRDPQVLQLHIQYQQSVQCNLYWFWFDKSNSKKNSGNAQMNRYGCLHLSATSTTITNYQLFRIGWITNLDCEFMLVLPVARQRDPRSKQDAISSRLLTLTSVTPDKVIPPLIVSRICIGGFTLPTTFIPPPNAEPIVPPMYP
jgi:hypothetical protein